MRDDQIDELMTQIGSDAEGRASLAVIIGLVIAILGLIMKKRVKRTKAKSSLKRARTKSKTRKAKNTKSRKTTKKTLLPKVKRVAKKAALAAGAAAIGTALSELQPETKKRATGRLGSDSAQARELIERLEGAYGS